MTAREAPAVEGRLVDTKKAAEFLSVSRHTLEAWRKSGDGPAFVKLGRVVRYFDHDLAEFIDGNRRTSTSEVAA